MTPRTPEEHAYAAANLDRGPDVQATRRRLSPWRAGFLLLTVIAVMGAIVAFRTNVHNSPTQLARSSFMPYVDVTATPQYAFEDAARPGSADYVLGFVVSARNDACQPTWGASYTLDAASTSLDLDRRIARLRDRGGDVIASFGGVANNELATLCTDPSRLADGYRSVVDRYRLDAIDLDVEGDQASATAVAARRATAIAAVQRAESVSGRNLAVWLTLPVSPDGLTSAGIANLDEMLSAGVKITGVNALTMDYGQSRTTGMTMTAANELALEHTAAQMSAAWSKVGRSMSPAQAWQHLGATPMIGQNDTPDDRFGLTDATALLSYAREHGLRRLSMWSANRDQSCGPNYANVTIVSDNCSGVAQKAGGFGAVFARFDSTHSAPTTDPSTPVTSTPTSIVDNPATSPYQIWSPDRAYVVGTKVVWHRNVYIAKWWTKGDTPDSPVASAYDTPWTLIGPVLPGEHPQPTPTMAAGTYASWSVTATYSAGSRVLYQGVGYQAKWWTHGNVPGTVVNDPGDTPWEMITSK